MAQFDVFPNPNAKARKSTPYVIILQNDDATGPWTVIVAPLVKKTDVPANDRLVVPVGVGGEKFVILFQAMAAVEKRLLAKPIANLADQVLDKLPRAIDFLFLGI